MPLMRRRRVLLKHVIVKKNEGIFTSKKMSRDRRSRDDLQRHNQRHSCKNRSARETRQDGEHEDGVLGDHGGGLLQDAPRSPRSLNELAARLSKQNTTTRSTQGKPHSAERRNKHTPGAQSLLFFPAACQSPKSGGLMFARREWERNDLAPSMTSVPKALSRAAHLMQQWPDGTKHSRRV